MERQQGDYEVGDVVTMGDVRLRLLALPTTTVRSEDTGVPLRTVRFECADAATGARVALKYLQIGTAEPGVWSTADRIISPAPVFARATPCN